MDKLTDNEVSERIAVKLKLERVRYGYTLQQVSNFTGIDVSDLSKFENATRQINFRNLNILLHFYDLNFEQFFRDFNTFDLDKSRNLFRSPCKK